CEPGCWVLLSKPRQRIILILYLPLCCYCGHKHSGPCGGRDCSGGCKCFPEKGARVSLTAPNCSILPNVTSLFEKA
uniref:TIL domain-containing protein n=1 Tax=Stegastes partitus TaxID=144197 RepID=A0A3B4ZDW8_9TELE